MSRSPAGADRPKRTKVKIRYPRDGGTALRGPVRVSGWALPSGSAPVARVEIVVDGRSAGRARLGLSRRHVVETYAGAEAAVSGFEHLVPAELLPEAGRIADIRAVAELTDGSTVESQATKVQVEEPEPPFEDLSGRAAELRERLADVARAFPPGRDRPEPGDVRVMAFTHDLELGGAQLYFLALLRGLDLRGGLSALLVSPRDGPLRVLSEAAGIPVHVTSDYGYAAGPDAYEGKLTELAALARFHAANVVVANTLAAFGAVDLAGRLGLPSIWSIHESLEAPVWSPQAHYWPRAHRYARERLEGALESASAVVFAAKATSSQYEHLGARSRFVTIPYGIDLSAVKEYRSGTDRADVRASLGLPESATAVLCLGSLEERKAQSTLARAFALVAGGHPDAVLCLVGSRGDAYAVAVAEYITRAGLEERIRVEPLSDTAHDWVVAADLLVCASDIESLPFTILEAMAFETPVLSTDVFGVPTMIEDGVTGYLCESRDVASLARGLDRALSAPEERAGLARAAAERVRANHDIGRYLDDYTTLLRSVVPG